MPAPDRGRSAPIRLKRAYDPPEPEDGMRLLVDRLWPRGLSKEKARIDAWLKELAPAPELRKWFGHEPDKWPEFRKRYLAQLQADPAARAAIAELGDWLRAGPVTLLYAARDPRRNNAAILAKRLRARFR